MAADRVVRPNDPELPIDVRIIWPAETSELHVRGPFPLARPAISIIGTTDPDPIARAWAFDCARLAVEAGWVIVSGMARGIDRAAHEGALAAGGVTAAVVANGLDLVYPQGSENLRDRILGAGGTIISISAPGEPATADRLLRRNRFTSAFADVVLAVQCHDRGGTIATMRHAARLGRTLATMAPPKRARPDAWSGNKLLTGQQAPWRDREIYWRPAYTLADPADLSKLFAHWRERPSVDGPAAVFETQKPEQPRLLEERATYAGDE